MEGVTVMFLDEMSTDLEPADYRLVARSLSRRLKREKVRNEHLHQLLRDRNAHLQRLHKIVVRLRKVEKVND